MSIDGKKKDLFSKCDYLSDVHLWPLRAKLNPEAWLDNFTDDELPYALRLLDGFLYFSEFMTDELVYAAVHSLSRKVCAQIKTRKESQSKWGKFLRSCIFVPVMGETPSVTDSGLYFARKARQVLGAKDDQFLSPADAIAHVQKHGLCPIIFLDDFVGSGNQFLVTWNKNWGLESFKSLASRTVGGEFYYCPVLCTEYGLKKIQSGDPSRSLEGAPQVCVNATHVIGSKYSALSADSIIWPEGMHGAGISFLRSASKRAGIPDSDGDRVDDWQGYRKLGLVLGFSHSVPDATLTILRWEKNGWKPLIKRS